MRLAQAARAAGSKHVTPKTGDDALARAAASGDRGAFAMLAERHYERIYRIAYGYLGHRAAAEDTAQDACIRLGQAIGKFRGKAAFTTWLYRLVLNVARDKARAVARDAARSGGERDDGFEALSVKNPGAGPDELAEVRQAMRVLDALPAQLKETVLLVHWQGLSHAEAGDVLDCREGTVSWRLSEARKLLSEKIDRSIGSGG